MYQQCPFCNRVFEIGETDFRPMKAHIRAVHTDTGGIREEAVAATGRGAAD